MQWLIDLVIEAIGIPPVFIDRGDPATVDWILAQLTVDNNWHELDLSAIVPAGAKGVLFQVNGVPLVTTPSFYLRKHGNVNSSVVSIYIPNVVGVSHSEDLITACSDDRKVDYLIGVGSFTDIDLIVKGWWL